MPNTYIANTYARAPVTFTEADGSAWQDDAGRSYIDLGSGIAVNTLGRDAGWAAAVAAQAAQLAHTSNLYYTKPQEALAKTLCERTGLRRVFFCNSGAEANECLLKTARKWAADRWGEEERPVIITLENSFHGRTLFTLAATGQDAFHHDFGPYPGGFDYAKPNDAASLEAAFARNAGKTCALLIELIQGEGGVVPLTADFVAAAVRLCAQYDALLCIDEVQTGNGRTGTLYAYEQYGLEPDIVSTAKGLAGGLPLGACLFGARTADTLTPGSHGSTFGGNPICCAAANYVLSKIDEDLLLGVKARQDYIVSRLLDLPWAEGITGKGLMLGFTVKEGRTAKEIAAKALQAGVVVLTAHEKVRLLPALNIPMETLEKAMDILAAL